MPAETIQQVFANLHTAAKNRRFVLVATNMRSLLQRAKMSEPMLLQIITEEEKQEASAFWWTLLNAKFPTPLEVVVKSAHAYYAVVYRAGEEPRMASMREQAQGYCEHIAEVCEQYLQKPTLPLKALPAPRRRPTLSVAGGKDYE